MVLIVCLDDHGGMLFNHRRQSRDRALCADMLQHAAGKRLWMNAYSHKLFAETDSSVMLDEDCLAHAAQGDFCFVENLDVRPFFAQIEALIVYRWNRRYPADRFFPFALHTPDWNCIQTTEFPGSSHEKITKEVYRHEKTV